MNSTNFESEIDDRTLDRLVDGELTGAEYQEVLRKLDASPSGWRRCALAFLESQAWGAEIRAAGSELLSDRAPSSSTTVPSEASPSVRRSGKFDGWRYGLVLALSCAATFALTVLFASQWRLGEAAPESNQFAGGEGSSHSVLRPKFEKTPPAQLVGNGTQRPGRYRLVVNQESGQPRSVEMPVISADDPRAMWLLDDYANRPRELIRQLEQIGHRVEAQRQWIPIMDERGVPIYVPVDDLHVTPVTNRAF